MKKQQQERAEHVNFQTGEALLAELLEKPGTMEPTLAHSMVIAEPPVPISEDFAKLMAGNAILTGQAVQKSRRRCIKCLYCKTCGSMRGPCGGAGSDRAAWLDVEVDVPDTDRLYHQYSHHNCTTLTIS